MCIYWSSDSILAKTLDTTNEISIDEQYMPKNPVKFCVMNWVLADFVFPYVCNFQIYTGKNDKTPEAGLSHRVILDLAEPYLNKGHKLFMVNFYSLPAIYEELYDKKILAYGTVRQDRKGMPWAIMTKFAPNYTRGQSHIKSTTISLLWDGKIKGTFLHFQLFVAMPVMMSSQTSLRWLNHTASLRMKSIEQISCSLIIRWIKRVANSARKFRVRSQQFCITNVHQIIGKPRTIQQLTRIKGSKVTLCVSHHLTCVLLVTAGLYVQALAGHLLICRGSRESILLVVQRRERKEDDIKFVEVRKQMKEKERTQKLQTSACSVMFSYVLYRLSHWHKG